MLSWAVDDSNVASLGLWHYEYTLTVPRGGISHMIVEVSDDDPGPAFTLGNLFSPTADPQGWTDAGHASIQLFTPGGSNPGMPGDLYGLKFDGDDGFDETTVTVSFDSNRGPVWGDFYAKDGMAGAVKFNAIWNEGFLVADPIDPAGNGSILHHLLVPDSNDEEPPGAIIKIVKFLDGNEDGLLDFGEELLEGWSFLLHPVGDPDSNQIVTTGPDGSVTVAGLAPGDYLVTELGILPGGIPAGWQQTTNGGNAIVVTVSTETIVEVGNIPEPATILLLGAGGAGFLLRRRKRQRR